MFPHRLSSDALAKLIIESWPTHQIDIGQRADTIHPTSVPPYWLVRSELEKAILRQKVVTLTPHTPYPQRTVYSSQDGDNWVAIDAYTWTEVHPINGVLFTLTTGPHERRYEAVTEGGATWHTLRTALSTENHLNSLQGFFIRDFNVETSSFRYYPAAEIAEKAEGALKGHRWHRRRYKAVRVFLKLEQEVSHV